MKYLEGQNIQQIIMLFLLIVTLCGCSKTTAQSSTNQQKEQNNRKQEVVKQVPADCDYIRTLLDNAMYETQNSKGSYLIIVFRSGKQEKSPKTNEIRMKQVESFIKFRKAIDRYVLAEGDEVDGLGKAEIYIEGKLKEGFFFKSNSKLFCEDESW